MKRHICQLTSRFHEKHLASNPSHIVFFVFINLLLLLSIVPCNVDVHLIKRVDDMKHIHEILGFHKAVVECVHPLNS